jgi:MEMO1 family protein
MRDGMDEPLPGMRQDLDLVPIQQGRDTYILVRDPLGLGPEGRALPPGTCRFLGLLDGRMSLRDLQMELIRQQGGTLVRLEEVRRLIDRLDREFLLDSPVFRTARRAMVEEFTLMQVRPPSHAGQSYPSDPAELSRRLEGILQRSPKRPGDGRVSAVVAPHIDLSAGEMGYASAYGKIRGSRASRIVILGVGHRQEDAPFSVTCKDFDTPVGKVCTDRDAVIRLQRAAPGPLSPDDFAHRSEHSVEFQTLFLSHLFRDRNVRIVPVLVGPVTLFQGEYSRKAFREAAGPFLDALRALLSDARETLLLAGVDLSHVGPKFGDQLPAQALQLESEAHDRALLACLAAGDAEGFWKESIRVRDRYHVCGFGALATLLEVLPPGRGELLHYEMWHEAPTRSAVSFAALCFTAEA